LRDAVSAGRRYAYGQFTGGSAPPHPTVTFSDRYTLTVGSQTLELEYRNANHEPGNIFIYAPRQKVLMLVDVIYPGWAPFKLLAMSEDIPGWVKAHDDVLSYEFDTYVGGHVNRLGTRKDAKVQREYILDIERNAARALQTVEIMPIAEETGFENPWLLFDRYLDAVTQQCYDRTAPKWIDRLGAVDVFTFDHCFLMAESLRID
jgi:glyoxylase-like metal-dependent hydrolase (beta-lactamase superfamily II)